MRVISFGEMPGFDPVKLAFLGVGIERAALVFDTLLYRNDVTGKVSPDLAKSMTSSDGIHWVMTLRPDVKFTDGTPLNAAAVIFNLKRHMAPDSTSVAKSYLSGVKSMRAKGNLEVDFTLAHADGSFPMTFTASSPAGLIGSPKALADPTQFNAHPVGAGPFKLQSWTQDSELKLVKNPDYWQKGKPYLDGVDYKIQTDMSTTANSLNANEADVALIDASQYQNVQTNPNFKLWPPTGGGSAIVANEKRPVGDPKVREAISLAFDPDTTKAVLFPGAKSWGPDLGCIPFAAASPACTNDDLPSQDVAKAKQLVEQWVAEGNDPHVSLTYFSTLTDQATYIQQQLAKIGLTVKLVSVDTATEEADQDSHNYDLFWASTASSGYPTYWERLVSTGTNWPNATIPAFDSALNQGREALTADQQNQGWQDSLKVTRQQSIATWLMPYPAQETTSTKLHFGNGLTPYLGSTMLYYQDAWLTK